MKLPYLARDKADTLLLLGAALLVLAPHALHLPPWVSLLCFTTLAWRTLITLRGLRMPPSLLLLPIAMGSMAAIFNHFHSLLGREPGVAMLVLLLTFKMLEMHARRDLFVVIFLCLFLVLTNFFYSQSIGTALLMVASVGALLAAQMSFQYTGAVPPLARRLRSVGAMLLLALPMAALLFVLFPRIHGPLWGMPSDAGGARSGLSEQMAPGSVSRLALSDEVAFRARFEGPIPTQTALYWRGIVLSDYDGTTWTRLRRRGARPLAPALELRGKPVRYQVTLEPTNSRWLFALELPEGVPDIDGAPVLRSYEMELNKLTPVAQRIRYQVVSHPDFALAANDDRAALAPWLMLPDGVNPQARRYGASLTGPPGERIGAVLSLFNRGSFSYTLEPPLLGTDAVDEFLFRTKAGFCEHYAGAFVVLMRAAGIPARVVTGYQGGELNPVDGYLSVRQSDAHAWAEVWLAGRGWLRIDPTAAVAPERVQRNLSAAVRSAPPFGMAALAPLVSNPFANVRWIVQLRFQLAALGNGWNQWVLNYTPERQRDTLNHLRRWLDDGRLPLAVALLLSALLLWRALRQRQRIDRIDALYSALCGQLAHRGLARAADEGPSAYSARLQARGTIDTPRMAAIARFLQLYSAHKYGVPTTRPDLAATLQRLLNDSA